MHLGRAFLRTALLAAGVALASPAAAGYLNGVTSHDGLDVIAVGDSGMIYRAVDGGALVGKSYQGTTSLRSVAKHGLTILIVGDGGKILRSADNGMSWSTTFAAGSPRLLGVAMPTATDAFVVGEGGTFLRSGDGGVNWTLLPTGTSGALRNLRFLDADNGWIVGDDGFIRRTADGGDNWSPGSVPTANHLYDVDQLGQRVWVVGAGGTCWKSDDDGAGWTAVNLKIDSRSDVRGVTLQGADSVFISGGGGFIRRSVNNGATWTFLQHLLLGEIVDMHFVGARGWVVSPKSPAMQRTADRGASWGFALGTIATRSWVQKQAIQAGSNRGSAIALNPVNRNTIYAAIGSRFYVTHNDGENWTQFAQLPAGFSKVNAFLVSPKDSMVMVCTASPPQVLLRSDDRGATWDTTRVDAFGEYGIPLEMHPDFPDTILFGPDNDVLYRSTDFGRTWAAWGSKVFRSPCDIVIVPESDSSAVLVGDGITGSGLGDLWRSTDGGVNFTKHYTTTGSEIPGMSVGRLDNKRAFATNWSIGGVERTTNTGLQWTQILTTANAWGTDVCKEDPNLVMIGVYSGGLGYLSLDGGTSFTSASLPGSNYSFFARDRGCVLAEQGGGMYKLVSTYAFNGNNNQTLTVLSANGGETWAAGSTHDITWNSTGLVMARVEYRVSDSDPWVEIGLIPGYYNRLAWTLPMVATSTARVRVSDAFDGAPVSQSSSTFTIALPTIAGAPDTLDLGSVLVGGEVMDSVMVTNTGTADLEITAVGTGTAYFDASPATLSLEPGASAPVYVTFSPDAAQGFNDVLTLTSNAGNDPNLEIPLTGEGLAVPSLSLADPDGGEVFQYGTSQKVSWNGVLVPLVDLEFRTGPIEPWLPIAAGVPTALGSFEWVIPNAPTASAQLRVRETGGGLEDVSAGVFSIVVPAFASLPPDIHDIGSVTLGTERTDTLRISNAGTALLTISSVTSSRPTFRLGRSSMTVPPGGSDTLGVTYTPESVDRDTTTVHFVADDPGAPHDVLVTGLGSAPTGVDLEIPVAFSLGQNLPNPFRATTRITYALPRASGVSLEVFNLQGQRIATLFDGPQDAGVHQVRFSPRRSDGSPLPAGVYFYRFRAGAFSATRKMLLMR